MRRLPNFVLGLLAFVTSAAVLVVEIVAARLLAPYVGVTLETYTAIIGTVLAGIAAGAWLGGKLADAREPLASLPLVLVVGGVLTLLSIPVVRFVGNRLTSTSNSAVILITAAAFLAPAIVLSMTTPLLAKARISDLSQTGSAYGGLSAMSTAGALLGSFTTGFVLVPRFRSRTIIGIVGALIILLGAVLWFLLRRRGRNVTAASSAMIAIAGLASGTGIAGSSWRDPCQLETAYFCAAVETDPDVPSRRLLVLDDVWHSTVDLNDPTWLGFEYAQSFDIVIESWRPEPAALRVLHIGGGGFTFPGEIKATRPGSDNLVLEIDQRLVRFDQERMGLKLADDLRTQGGDGRMGLRNQPAKRWDLVLGDAFGGQSIPWHLTTREVVVDVQRTLADDGLYLANVIDNPPLNFLKAEVRTIADVFKHVALISYPEALAGEIGANFTIAASRKPLPLDTIRAALAANTTLNMKMITGDELVRFWGNAKILTDDFAPVAQLFNRG